MSLWKELRLLRLATFARVLRTAAAANARLPARAPARPAAALPTSLARRSNFYLNWLSAGTAFYQKGAPGSFYVTPL